MGELNVRPLPCEPWLGYSSNRSRAYSAKGRTPEHRSREAQRAAGRSAAGRRSRRPPARSLRDRHHLYSGANELRVLGGEKCRTALLLRGHTTSLSSEV